MKKILLTLALPLLITAGLAPRAEAGRCYSGNHTYVSGRAHCGCPIYSQRIVAYYNRCGQPVFQVRVLPVDHQCRSRYQPQYHPQYRQRPGCAVVVPPSGCGLRSNYKIYSPLPVPPLPRVSFSPGHSIHVGFGLP